MTEQTAATQAALPTQSETKSQGESPSMTSEQYREQGAQALTKDDFESAIDLFSKALQAKIAECGNELAPECAAYYFDYGDAMLQQCSQKSDVFGRAIKQAQEKFAVEIIEETANDNEEAAENETAADEVENSVDTNGAEMQQVADENDGKEIDEDVAEQNASEGQNQEDGEEDEQDDEEEEGNEAAEDDVEDADEPTDLEMAWELLETARVIYSRMDMNYPSNVFGLGDCYSRLGDLALENDTNAITDYTQCLNVLSSITDEDSISPSQLHIKYRALGAVHFKMAVANSLTGESTNALSFFQDAQKALLKVSELILGKPFNNGKSEAGSESIPFDAIKEAASALDKKQASDINELIELLQKIQEKIEDLLAGEPMKSTEVTTMVNEIMADAADVADGCTGFDPSAESCDPRQVNDLGTIVGQKRKMVAEETEAELPAKIAKSDEA